MEQPQQGFSDSTPRAGSVLVIRLQNSSKSLLSDALQLISNSQIAIQKYWSGHFCPYKVSSKFCPKGGRLSNHSDPSKDVLRILKLYFYLFQNKYFFF